MQPSVGHAQASCAVQLSGFKLTHYPGLGSVLTELGRASEAEPLLRDALRVYARNMPNSWYVSQAQSLLGGALAAQGRFTEAEPLLLEGFAGLKDDPAVSADRKRSAVERVARLYESWNESQPGAGIDVEAAEWRARLAAPPAESAKQAGATDG